MTKEATPIDRPAEVDSHLRTTLDYIAGLDCRGLSYGGTDDEPCECVTCIARKALQGACGWRFRGALASRTEDGFHPAEARMVAAWRKYVGDDPDTRLSLILDDQRRDVTARDWYVATSVVQWLATAVGSTIVEAAGYRYTKYDEDRALRDAKLPPQLGEVTCDSCRDEDSNGRTYCGFCGRRINRIEEGKTP